MSYWSVSLVSLLLVSGVFPVLAQPRVDSRQTYERIVAVVPMTGAGTAADPLRPKYAPLPRLPAQAPSRAGILAFNYVMSDDGKSAIVEFVARDRAALLPILNDPQLAGKVFQKGTSKRADVELALKKYKKDFSLDKFAGVAVQ